MNTNRIKRAILTVVIDLDTDLTRDEQADMEHLLIQDLSMPSFDPVIGDITFEEAS